MINPVDRRARREIMERIRADAAPLAARFELRYRAIQAERSSVTSRYGVCFSDGTIRIRLNHATTRQPLKYSSLVNTLCHELAHLRHFHHGPSFQRFYYEILEYARDCGIYRPGPTPGAAARSRRRESRRDGHGSRTPDPQLSLFADDLGG